MANISNSASDTIINGTSDNDYILTENANNVIVDAGSGDDVIRNNVGNHVSINGGDGNDVLISDESEGAFSSGGEYATLIGGKGNDTIFSWAEHAVANGGSGDDYISVPDFSTVTGGDGSDTLYCITTSHGSMTITDFDETKDVLELGQSMYYATGDSKLFTVNSYIGGVIIENKYYKLDFKGQTLEQLKKANVTYQNPIITSVVLPTTLTKLGTLIYDKSPNPPSNVINNTYDHTIVAGSNNADIITNVGNYVTIHGNGGNDSIVTGDGSASKTSNSKVTINSGTGDDTIDVYSSDVVVYAGAGNDHISTWYLAERLTIEAGAGNDVIDNYSAKTSIYGGTGNDVIHNNSGQYSYAFTATDVTINGGTGNDVIYLSRYPEIIQYESDKDVIYNYSSTDKIYLKNDNISKASLEGSDVIVTVGSGTITLKDAKGEKITIINSNRDIITFTDNYGSSNNRTDTDTTIYSGIDIEMSKSSLASLKVAKDILSALNKIAQSKLDDKDDKSFIGSVAVTISSLYAIVDSAIKMGESKYSDDPSKKLSEGDLAKEFLNLGNNVTRLSSSLPQMLGKEGFIIPLSSYVMTLVTNVIATSDGASKNEVAAIMESSLNIAAQTIKLFGGTAFGKTFAGGILNKLATHVASKAFWLIPPIIGLYVGYETYKENLGTYSDDGYEESMIIRNAFIDGAVDFLHTTFTKWTFGLDDDVFNGIQYLLSSWSKKRGLQEVEIADRNYMEWIGEAIKIVMDGAMHVDVTANDGKLSNTFDEVIINGRSEADEIRNHGSKVSIYGCGGNDTITTAKGTSKNYVHSGKGNDLIMVDDTDSTVYGDGDDDSIYVGSVNKLENGGHKIYGESGNDVIYVTNVDKNTLSGGKGNDIIILENADNQLIIYGNNEGRDIVFGYNETDNIRLASTTYSTIEGEKDITIESGNGSIVLDGAKGKKLNIISRTDVKNSTSVTLTDASIIPFKIGSNIININATKRTKPIRINGNTLANIISGGSDSDSIYGGAGDDSIIGNAGADKLYGESGKDTLNGGKDNDTLTGGAGNDVFIYQSGQGNDVITDYATGDKLSITGGKYTRSTVGNDVKFTVGTGSIILKNAKGKNISVSGTEDTKSTTTTTSVTLTNADRSPYTTGSKIKTINASSRIRGIKITGNTLANSIRGGSAADTLNGGKGNDTLTGGNGADIFQYSNGDGNDVITDYTASDRISLSSSSSYSTTTSGQDVFINVGNGSIRLKNAKSKKLNITGGKPSGGNSTSTNTTKIPIGYTTINVDSSHSILNEKSKVVINGTSSQDDINNYASNVIVNGNAGKDYIYSSEKNHNNNSTLKNVTINGGAGNDTIFSFTAQSSISGGDGNDEIYGSADKVTINGGKGNDTIETLTNNVILYAEGDGNDVITTIWEDTKIKITSGSYSTLTSGNDFLIEVGSGKITIKDYADFADLINITGTRNFEDHWFTEDNNFINNNSINNADDLTSIINDNSNSIAVDYKFTDEKQFKQHDKISALTPNKLNK